MSADISPLNPPTVWEVPEAFQPVYTHATEVALGTHLLFVSGQFGVRPDGSLPDTFDAQAAQALANVRSLLTAARMGMENLVKLTFFLTRSTDAPALVAVRAAKLEGLPPPAVTVVTVSALARPDYLVEVEAIAVA